VTDAIRSRASVESTWTVPIAVTVFGLGVAGSFISFAATNSQAQFAALNAAFLYSSALVALFGVCVIPSRGIGRSSRGLTVGALAVLVFATWGLISSVLSGRFMSAVLGEPTSLMGLGALTAGALIALFAQRSSGAMHRVMLAGMPILVLAQGVWAFAQEPTIVDAGHGGFGNSSALGLGLALAVPWVLANAGEDPWTQPGRARRPVAARGIGAALLAVFALAVSLRIESRSSAALIGLTCVWYVVVRSPLSARIKRVTLFAFAALGATAVGIMVAAERAAKLPFGFLTIRYALWSTAMRAFSARPLLGWGADGFFSGGSSVTGRAPGFGAIPLVFADGTTDPHSLPVFVVVCFGAVGFVLLLVLGALLVRHVIARRQSLERFDPAVVALAGGFISLLITPFTLDVLPLFALTLGLCLASPGGSVTPCEATTEPRRTVLPAWAFRGVCALAAVATTALAIGAIGVVRLGPVGYFSPAPLAVASRSAAFLRLDPYVSYQVSAAFAQTTGPAQVAAAKRLWEESDPARAMRLDSRNPYYALGYAQALWNAGGSKSEVVAAYEEALARYPSFPAAHADLALLYATSGQPDRARSELAQVGLFGDWGGYPWGATASAAQRAIESGQK